MKKLLFLLFTCFFLSCLNSWAQSAAACKVLDEYGNPTDLQGSCERLE